MYTAMVKDPFRKWDRVYTVCALLVDLGTQFQNYRVWQILKLMWINGDLSHDCVISSHLLAACVSAQCSHLCVSEAHGGARCLCATGFTLQPDRKSCIGEQK